ncbi:hypothetical protein LEP1GSC036_4664 [Leptospira weilii str. 2006001853]|uniref:Uncharacterized protein n=1 Tax=Leptospira weilii str. 2006001853 TaxID=1001589 RepID=A0A828Z5V7_9LEPT|nr:hypothetical protein LEP1GSC036_4664 [Leptospira weilii str. 2006001853]EMN45860.1 hypothetical protein LEP1GSC086_2658 [Leptospira weilii str. LNT 1234]
MCLLIFGITILNCIGCSDSNEPPIPIRTLSVSKNLKCNDNSEAHIRSLSQKYFFFA